MLSFKKKQMVVAEINEIAKSALSIVIADSCGVTVDKMTRLRKASREAGVYMCVVRNTLMRRVVKGTSFECLKDTFVGPTLVAFSIKHPGSAARLFKAFEKENGNFKVKIAAFEGRIISVSQIDLLATLPTYEESIIRLISVIKEASAKKLVFVLTTYCTIKKKQFNNNFSEF